MSVVATNGPDSLIWWDWVDGHRDLIKDATFEHLRLTLIAVGVGFVISGVLAMVALRFRWAYAPITWVTGVLYTIPSLALFVILVPITGFTTLTGEIGLVSYTLLILIRNIVAGVDGVPASVKEAADAMGYRPARRFFSVDLRLATPAIVAGLRIATVTTIGLVTVTGLIGLGGYGSLIDDGLNRTFSTPIVVGAGLSVVMAVVLDLGLVGVERALTPWARRRAAR
ncbi:MAG: osmoprotectant transport system permease protein [Acidimicrobiaceae bacterium]|jgi:osmoprotectant transport system permease protein